MTSTEINYDLSIKLVVVGESGVGKSNLIIRFVQDKFDENIITTIALDFHSEEITIKDKWVKVQIWDTAGQEKYKALAKSYYKVANGIIIVYDITDRKSFEKAKNWVDEIKMFALSSVKIMLVGNKIDLFDQRTVTTDEAVQFAKEKNLLFYETSSKTNQEQCVNKAFYKLLEETVDSMLLAQEQEDKDLREMVIKQTHRLVQSQLIVNPPEKKGCC